MPDRKRTHDNPDGNAATEPGSQSSEPPRKIVAIEMAQDIINSVNSAFLANRFETLRQEDISDPTAENTPGSPKETGKTSLPVSKKLKVPPIIIKDIKYAQLQDILKSLGITVHNKQFMSIGIKVMLNSMEAYDTLYAFLTANKDKYKSFSFEAIHKTPIRIVLSGLPIMNTDEIKTEINHYTQPKKIVCENVHIMKTKQNRYDEFALYLLSFSRENFNFQTLRAVNSLFQIRVRWSAYKRRSGPTQCSNCQLYGHGSNHCNLPTVCGLCTGAHNQIECENLASYENGIYCSIKCNNCDGKHPANSLQCPKRQDFINMRELLSRKANLRNRRQGPEPDLAFEDKLKYPSLRPPRRAPDLIHKQQQPNRLNFQDTYASQLSSTTNNQQFRSQPPVVRQNCPENHHQDASDDLFTPKELLHLTREMVTSLKGCRNKEQQFDAIAHLALKYLYGSFNV